MKVSSATGVKYINSMHDPDPSGLVSQCIAGDEAAIETLVRRYEEGVFRLALSIVDDAAEAAEITQETFISALRSMRTYREQQTFKAWLFTIAVNQSRSRLRKRKALERLQSTLGNLFHLEIQRQRSPEDIVLQNEKEELLWQELNRLDEKHRMVVVLRYFHELSVPEISGILATSEGTIHSRLHYAREKLRNALDSWNGEVD